MSGTDIGYAAPRSYAATALACPGTRAPIVLRTSYAVPGTDTGYAATQFPVTWPQMPAFDLGHVCGSDLGHVALDSWY
eukprot:1775420-Rhodomonas_salina.1